MQKNRFYCLYFVLLTTCSAVFGQTPLDGYVFEANNRGFLNQVKVTIYDMSDNSVRLTTLSDSLGHFGARLSPGQYRITAKKDIFHDRTDTVLIDREQVYLKMEMRRQPGYMFDATLAESRDNPDQIVDAIAGATVEIYNRTQQKPELVLKNHPRSFFDFHFEQGNHYTMLIRKPGYIAKRIEAYVNVKGCIICVDGVRELSPGVTDNLTAGNEMGTLLANIDLDRAKVDKRITIQNIYYDYDKYDIRPDAAERLDKVVTLLKDNPGMSVELGSHTDARGNDVYNAQLSQRRAEAAVAYIVSEGIDNQRITAKGYGETALVNRCRNGVSCSEEEHQQNRRTELRITGISADSLEYLRWPSLEQIIKDEAAAKAVKAAPKKGGDGKDRVIALETCVDRAGKVISTTFLPKRSTSTDPAFIEKAQKSVEGFKFDPNPDEQCGTITFRYKGDEMQNIDQTKMVAKSKTRREQPLPEANNSVKMGEMIPVVGQSTMPDLPGDFTPRAIAAGYTGFSVEIIRTGKVLVSGRDTILEQLTPTFLIRESDKKYTYLVGQLPTLGEAQAFLKGTVLAKFPKARIVAFNKGKKSYVPQ